MMRVRKMKREESSQIDELSRQADMDVPEDYDIVTVACADGATEIDGFLRVKLIGDAAYVNPVIVAAPLRGTGVGRRLMEDVMGRYDDVRLVARGYCVGFYRKLGFDVVPWDDIAPELARDCSTCGTRGACSPVPMAWRSVIAEEDGDEANQDRMYARPCG